MQRVIHWPAQEAVDVEAYAALDDASRSVVAQAPVPVLVPNRSERLTNAKVMAGRDWVAVWAQRDGITVTIQASGRARVYPHIKPTPGNRTLRAQEGFITHNEGVWAASWREFGVAYSLEIECADPQAASCHDESTTVSLVESLVYVGGRGRQEGGR